VSVLSTGNEITMALLSQDLKIQDQENPPSDPAWTVLDAANDLGDAVTIDACRRVIDANLRGDVPAASDMALIAAFFG
jgi:hypothetical protein